MKKEGDDHIYRYAFIPATLLTACLLMACSGSTGSGGWTEEGYSRIEAHRYEEALESFEKAREEGELQRLIDRGEGISLLTLGEYEQAEEKFLSSLAGSGLIPEKLDYDTNLYLAECLVKEGKFVEAIEVYDAVLTLKDKNRDARYLRGVAELSAGMSEKAWADFNKVMAMDPTDYDRLLDIYEALASAGMENDGLALLQRAMNDGSSSMTNYEKGRISYYLGNNAEAQSFLEQARNERDVDKLPVVIMLGKTAEKQGDYNYAVSVYRMFLSDDAAHPEVWNSLGLCLMKMGDYDSAIAAFESGRTLPDGEKDRALMRNEVVVYEYSGQFQQARILMEKYLKAWPDDEEARREYIFLSTR